MVPDIEEIAAAKYGHFLSPEKCLQWKARRELFLHVLEIAEKEASSTRECHFPIASMMKSPRSAFANILNLEGIVGFRAELPRDCFLQWLGTIIGEDGVDKFKNAI